MKKNDNELKNIKLINQSQKLKKKICFLEKKNKHITLRTHANIDNFNKQYKKEIKNIKKINLKNFLNEFITIIHKLENTMHVFKKKIPNDQSTIQGIKLIKKSLYNTFNKFKK